MTYLVERVAQHLAKHGNASTRELADALGVPASRIGDCIKSERQRARWGIYHAGYVEGPHGRGHPPSIWAINKAAYKKHVKDRREMPWLAKRLLKDEPKSTKPKAPSVKEPKVDYSRKPPVYSGPHRTVWQPSSPYWRDK